MKMTFRWFGSNMDPIPLQYIKQIPNLTGVVTSLMDIPVGEVWPEEKIMAMKAEVEAAGLEAEVIESVNVHEDIKLGLPSREQYIETYIQTIRNLRKAGIKVICYNFMPIFDWTRSDLAKGLPDGSNALSYDQEVIDRINDVQGFADKILQDSTGFEMPGWEPDRLEVIKELFHSYEGITKEDLFANLNYFLKAVIPVCEECDIRMAIHPDDPPWDVFGIPRIANSKESLDRIVSMIDSEYNGITLCSGSLGADRNNNIPDLIRYFGGKGKIPFIHLRNIKILQPNVFQESSHLSSDGSFDMYEIMKALDEIGFQGYIRPDHGRMIWGEKGRAGYGLYDRALGVAYLNGLWEAIQKTNQRQR